MSRTGNNIYKRKDGRWEARYIKFYDEKGKAKYGYVYAKTYKEVKRKQELAITNNYTHTKNRIIVLLEDVICDWLNYQRNNVKESTHAHYHYICYRHIIPKLGKYEITKISTVLLDLYINELLTNGRIDSQGGLSKKTVSDIIVVLKSILQYAKMKEYNIVCQFKHLNIKKERKEIRILSPLEQKQLKETLCDQINEVKLGIYICLYTGIRIGEICALKWEDINLEERLIYIRSTLQRIQVTDSNSSKKTRIMISTPKTSSSLRSIPIPDYLFEVLSENKRDPEIFVLTGKANHFMEPRSLQYQFKKILKEANIEYVNFHVLRHTFASRCIELGFETKSLSEILGHATVNMTLNKYVHTSFNLKYEQMQKLNAF